MTHADDIQQLAADIIKDAEARHRENGTTYFDALHRIAAVCAEYEHAPDGGPADVAMRVVGRIARKAIKR